MRPSPIREENQRWARVSIASSRASPAASPAMPTTSAVSFFRMPSSMITFSSSGTATMTTASSTTTPRNRASEPR